MAPNNSDVETERRIRDIEHDVAELKKFKEATMPVLEKLAKLPEQVDSLIKRPSTWSTNAKLALELVTLGAAALLLLRGGFPPTASATPPPSVSADLEVRKMVDEAAQKAAVEAVRQYKAVKP